MTISGHAEQRDSPPQQVLDHAKRMAGFALAAYHPEIKSSPGGRCVSGVCRLPQQICRRAASNTLKCTGDVNRVSKLLQKLRLSS